MDHQQRQAFARLLYLDRTAARRHHGTALRGSCGGRCEIAAELPAHGHGTDRRHDDGTPEQPAPPHRHATLGRGEHRLLRAPIKVVHALIAPSMHRLRAAMVGNLMKSLSAQQDPQLSTKTS
jgi:hypothetical protein